ncbi:ABC transporter substrate-binding protein [Paenibacillus sp. 1P07SE]|uniref:ABC transporter substrate-binding protein n=1 Tax=Paenibacillus sp. 1P07SE TaxID=3132209 RepID=UPI0039A5351E
MKLNLQYLQLHKRFGSVDEIELTLADIAETLDCTHRSAVTIMGKLAALGWIDWNSRRGRARRSSLRFLAEPREIARASLHQAMNSNQLRRSLEQLVSHAATDKEEPFEVWLASYFGHRAEVRQDRQIDILRLPIREQLHSIDPLTMNLVAESFVSSHVYDVLVRRSRENGEMLPGLAHAWESEAEGRRWTFYLRKGVNFHDGRTLTADDVVYSLERLIHPARRTLYGTLFRLIRSVRALTPAVVAIELTSAHELFLPLLSTSRAGIISRSDGRSSASQAATPPAGTGPFKPVHWEPALCVLEANPHYHLGRAQLDRVEIVHVPWASGHAQPDPHAPFHIMHHAGAPDTGWSRISSETRVCKFITCNTKRGGPLTRPAVRSAVMAALAESSPHPVPDSSPLLAEPLRLMTIEHYREDARQAADRLASAGYRCEVTTASPDAFKGERRLSADLILFSLLRDQDVQLRLYDLYATMQSHLDSTAAERVDRTLQAVSAEAETERRMMHFDELEAALVAEHQLHILYEKPVQAAYLPSVRGVALGAQGWMDLRKLWFPPVH